MALTAGIEAVVTKVTLAVRGDSISLGDELGRMVVVDLMGFRVTMVTVRLLGSSRGERLHRNRVVVMSMAVVMALMWLLMRLEEGW